SFLKMEDFNDFSDWAPDTPTVDNAEMIYISSLALLKVGNQISCHKNFWFCVVITGCLKHGRAEIPMKDMGLMLGELVYVEANWTKWWLTDITLTLDFDVGCINTQQSFEALNQRAVKSHVKSHPISDILINQALIHGLNRHCYSIAINYRKNELEQKMLLNLHKKNWIHGLTLPNFTEHTEINGKSVNSMLTLAESYNKSVREESTMTPEQLKLDMWKTGSKASFKGKYGRNITLCLIENGLDIIRKDFEKDTKIIACEFKDDNKLMIIKQAQAKQVAEISIWHLYTDEIQYYE
ncbi:12263_t:CDS:2, partial [Funneliformis caledonium]